MPITTADVGNRVRALVNDVAGDVWTDGAQLEFMNDANNLICNKFRDHGAVIFLTRSTFLNLPASTTSISFSTTPALPTDLIEPTELWEKDQGSTADSYTRVVRAESLPVNVLQQSQLLWWEWRGAAIQLLGATTARDLLLEYRGGNPAVLTLGAALPIPGSLPAIARIVAATIAHSRGQHEQASHYEAYAEEQILSLISQETKSRQGTPVRRRATSYARGGGYGPFSGV